MTESEKDIVSIDNGTLLLASALSADAFGKIRTQNENGTIATVNADGSVTFESWAFNGTVRAEDGQVYYSGAFCGQTLYSLLLADGSAALKAAHAVCRILSAAIDQHQPVAAVGAGGIIVDERAAEKTARVLFLPAELFERSARNHGERLYTALQGAFVNKSIGGDAALAFMRASIAYRAFCGHDAYTATATEERQADMFDGNFVPLNLMVTGVSDTVCDAIHAALCIPPALHPLPGEKRAMAKKLAENEARTKDAIASFDRASVCDALLSFAEQAEHVASDYDSLSEPRAQWQKKQRRRIVVRRFLRRNRTGLSVGAFAVLVAVWAITSYVNGNADRATSVGLTSRETIETLYTGVHSADVTVLQAVAPRLKDMMTIVSGFYVTNKQRLAMDQQNGTATPAEWLFFKNESDFWQYGLTQFTVDGKDADSSFEYPRRRDKKEPLASENGVALHKGASAHHTVRYNLVHSDSSEELHVEHVTDTVTLTWNGKKWLATAVESSSKTESVKIKLFRADYAAALEAADGTVADAVETMRQKYSWLPNAEELAAGARTMIAKYNNSAAKAYLGQ